jgi:pimeloyl-ACP methyl ester carboxylesterase
MKQFNHEKGHYFFANNTHIYVEETGNPEGFPFLFLHGGFGTIRDFSRLIGKISGNFRCIGIDARGHGKSKLGTSPLTYELLENDAESILDQLNISKCIVIGFSDGGIIGYRLAIKRPSLISKLITIGSDWSAPNPTLRTLFSHLTPETWGSKFPNTVSLYNNLNPEPNFELLMKAIIPMWTDMTASGYPAENVKEIHCDTLVIRGDQDPFITRDVIAHLSEFFPNGNLLNIPFAGHAVQIEQPEIVSIAIHQFLQK